MQNLLKSTCRYLPLSKRFTSSLIKLDIGQNNNILYDELILKISGQLNTHNFFQRLYINVSNELFKKLQLV